MLGSAHPCAGAGRAQQELPEQLFGRHPFGQIVAVVAMGADHRVIRAELGHDRCAGRFLADVGVIDAVHLIAAELTHLLFSSAHEQHRLEEGKKSIARNGHQLVQPHWWMFQVAASVDTLTWGPVRFETWARNSRL